MDDDAIRCQRCGGPVDAVDGWTDGSGALCGGVYGRGCDRSAWVWPAVAVLQAAHPGFLWVGGEDVDGWHRDLPEADRVTGWAPNVRGEDGVVAPVFLSIVWDDANGCFHTRLTRGTDAGTWVRRDDWHNEAAGQGAEWHVGVLPNAVKYGVRDVLRLAAVGS
jgi:hypothetical protein